MEAIKKYDAEKGMKNGGEAMNNITQAHLILKEKLMTEIKIDKDGKPIKQLKTRQDKNSSSAFGQA